MRMLSAVQTTVHTIHEVAKNIRKVGNSHFARLIPVCDTNKLKVAQPLDAYLFFIHSVVRPLDVHPFSIHKVVCL